MQDSNLRKKGDAAKISLQKPAIAAKPKYVPPVNLKSQRQSRDDATQIQNPCRKLPEIPGTRPHRQISREQPSSEKKVEVTEKFTEYKECVQYEYSQLPPPPDAFRNDSYMEYSVKYKECTYTEKCDKFSSSQLPIQNKTPSSPSTVCCSILSNATTDCCGIIATPNKKELNGKAMTKIDSIDSNSSDSGGFKDFIQLDLAKTLPIEKPDQSIENNQMPTHQRKISQPEFFDSATSRRDLASHQRKSSQPDCLSQDNRQSHSKKPHVINAQALAHFLPQEKPTRTDDLNRYPIGKVNVAQASQMFLDKSEERKSTQKPKQQLISNSQFLQSTRKLEELLSQRYESEKTARKGQSCLLDGERSDDVEQKMNIQKQINQKLQADLQQTVKQIQEIQSIELRLPQNRKWSEVSIEKQNYELGTKYCLREDCCCYFRFFSFTSQN